MYYKIMYLNALVRIKNTNLEVSTFAGLTGNAIVLALDCNRQMAAIPSLII